MTNTKTTTINRTSASASARVNTSRTMIPMSVTVTSMQHKCGRSSSHAQVLQQPPRLSLTDGDTKRLQADRATPEKRAHGAIVQAMTGLDVQVAQASASREDAGDDEAWGWGWGWG